MKVYAGGKTNALDVDCGPETPMMIVTATRYSGKRLAFQNVIGFEPPKTVEEWRNAEVKASLSGYGIENEGRAGHQLYKVH